MVIHFSGLCQSDLDWKEGVVVLSNREVLAGEISYRSHQDVVLFRSAEQLFVLPAHKIELFRYYDKQANIHHQFVSIKLEAHPSQIFEVVIQGVVKVLRLPKMQGVISMHDEVEGYHYFVWDGRIMEPARKFRSYVYPKLTEAMPLEMESFVINHGLNLNELRSALLIIKEYNRIVQSKPVIAQAY